MAQINGTPFDDNNTVNNGEFRSAIVGTDGDDQLFGLAGNDILDGAYGNDFLKGGRGNDTMIGGWGNDTLEWDDGEGNDTMSGGEGVDQILVDTSANQPDDFVLSQIEGSKAFFQRSSRPFTLTVDTAETFLVNGQNGDDSLIVNDLSQTSVQRIDFRAGEGNDTLRGLETGAEIAAYGEAGNDLLIGGRAIDTLDGGAGDDVVVGFIGDDLLLGGLGNDTIGWADGDGSDRISGGEGYDVVDVIGAPTKDELFTLQKDGDKAIFDRTNLGPFKLTVDTVEKFKVTGDAGNDSFTIQDLAGTGVERIEFSGGAGDDRLDGRGTNTPIVAFGDGGNDFLIGSNVSDTLEGGDGNDTVVGSRGDDTMIGGWGDDILIWNNGDGSDTIDGGEGNDLVGVNGAAGAGDVFTLKQEGNKALFDRLNLVPFTLTVDNSEAFEINGGGGDDSLEVSDLSATDVQRIRFTGGAGDDRLDGRGTNTPISADGGAGDDLLTGGRAADSLTGGEGNDTVVGFRGDDTMIGGWGDDRLIWNNGDGTDTISGGAGYDVVEANGAAAGDEFVLKAIGDKAVFDRTNLVPFTLTTDTSETFEVNGLAGDDQFTVNDLTGTAVTLIKFTGGDGNDRLNASATSTPIVAYGDAGHDHLTGGSGHDSLYGGDGFDVLNGGNGSDVLYGGAGVDLLSGNANNDVLYGEGGDDNLFGNSGNDTIDGGEGNDGLSGGTGDDLLYGGEGNDFLHGGVGTDTLTGGAGGDIFNFLTPFEGSDTITDFSTAEDIITVNAFGFELVTAISEAQFTLGAAAQSINDRFIYNQSTGALFFDEDGIGAAAQSQIAQLATGLNLTHRNIVAI